MADSEGVSSGKRITTFLLTYPRFIHSEFLTARVFSRNAASSRAIPIMKMIKEIWRNPAKPVSWGANGKGMQAKGELSSGRRAAANLVWCVAAAAACGFSWLLYKIGVHKQLANRVTEPFAHMTTLVTATEWENFFSLRAHPDAQPEFQALAFAMLEAYLASEPTPLGVGEWHLPFWRAQDELNLSRIKPDGTNKTEKELSDERLAVCTARCARTSYVNFYGKDNFDEDVKLHDRLSSSGHWSPFEHCAKAMSKPGRSGNFVGWWQYRKRFPAENRKLSREGMVSLLESRKKAS